MRTMKMLGKVVAVTLGLTLLLAGCSGDEKVKDIDMAAVAKDMVTAGKFDGEPTKITGKAVEKRYDLSQVEDYVVYLDPTGGRAEEVSLFKAKSGSAQAVKTMLEKHVEDQTAKFADYVPAEVYKLKNAIYVEKGDYVGLIVAADGSESEATFDKAFK